MVEWLSAEQLGQRLRDLRLQQGFTQEELATRVGWAAGSGWRISEYESGKKRPRTSTLECLLEGLEVDCEELLDSLPRFNATRVGQLIRLFRSRQGWTQQELAHQLNQASKRSFSARLIGAWERGNRHPRLPELQLLATWMEKGLEVFAGPPIEWQAGEQLAERIQQLRLDRGMTQAELARMMNRPGTQQHISRWERGLATPNIESLVELARTLEVDLQVFQQPQTRLALEE